MTSKSAEKKNEKLEKGCKLRQPLLESQSSQKGKLKILQKI